MIINRPHNTGRIRLFNKPHNGNIHWSCHLLTIFQLIQPRVKKNC